MSRLLGELASLRWWSTRLARRARLALLYAVPRDPAPLGRVLEIGCSVGTFTEALAPRCSDLLAIDISKRAVERAAERLSPLILTFAARRAISERGFRLGRST